MFNEALRIVYQPLNFAGCYNVNINATEKN